MTPNFINQYHPLTARPFLRNKTYEEQIPCKPLRPYVSCFWSSESTEKGGAGGLIRVIPDTCMDIMIDINYTKQIIKSCLCGIQDYLKQLESTLNQAEVIYLSTSKQDVVSSRPVSPLNIGFRLFVRTSAATRKTKEMTANPNIAVCAGNFYFTGKAKPLGSVHDAGDAQVKAAYIRTR